MENPISKDYLLYRYPGSEIVQLEGILEKSAFDNLKDGFIFTDFLKENCYIFRESSETKDFEIHFDTNKPYVFTKNEYLNQATSFLNCIQQLQLGKAVFSRIKTTLFDTSKTLQLFNELCNKYPNALVYLISGNLIGTWVGASPEVLLEAHDEYLFTMSLAGTKKVNANIEWTGKEIIEQELVTDFIADELKKMQVDSLEIIGPYDFEAGPVEHLRTDICAQISNISPLEIAYKLHPTPAVSGLPRTEAIALIKTLETHNRGLYTGMIGLISENSTRLFVNLRCAQIQEKNTYLYIGGGFTAQSIPEMEWEETENKSQTLLNVMRNL
jgi:isochorismate synthase